MAKKQSKGQRRKKQPPTLKKQISKNLSKRANKLLDHYEGVEALGKIGRSNSESSNLLNRIGEIFDSSEELPADTFNSKIEKILSKLKTLKQLIAYNITCTQNKKNFDTNEYIEDRKFVTDIVFKIHASSEVENDVLLRMNHLYKKHKQIKQLFD